VKYRLLSKEQLEALHKEFATFLAAQEITQQDWTQLKKSDAPEVNRQLENFSDLVWEEVLKKVTYLDHFSPDSINLFHCLPEHMERLVVQVNKKNINLLDKAGYDWWIDHSNDPSIQYFRGEKPYTDTRNKELFQLIEQGAVLSDGKLFNAVKQLLKK